MYVGCAVLGCGNFDPPEGATLQRSGEDAVVVCNRTGETWYVTCRDGYWLGTVGNCTKFGSFVQHLASRYGIVFVIIFPVLGRID